MNKQESLTEGEVVALHTLGLMRSLELLESFIVRRIDAFALSDDKDREILNRVKLRRNTKDHPIAVYLKPFDQDSANPARD